MNKFKFCISTAAVIITLLGNAPNAKAVLLSAGEATGINGDLAWTQAGGIVNFTDSDQSGAPIHIVLDIASIQHVGGFLLTNRPGANSNLNARAVNIYIAPDEQAPEFNPFSILSYTISVFSGDITPLSNVASFEREIDIVDSNRRYFLLDFTANMWGPITGEGNFQTVSISDMSLQIVPEPSSGTLILAAFGFGFYFHRLVKKMRRGTV